MDVERSELEMDALRARLEREWDKYSEEVNDMENAMDENGCTAEEMGELSAAFSILEHINKTLMGVA